VWPQTEHVEHLLQWVAKDMSAGAKLGHVAPHKRRYVAV